MTGYTICYMIGMVLSSLAAIGFVKIITICLESYIGVKSLPKVIFVIGIFFCATVLSRALFIYSDSKADNLIMRIRMKLMNDLNQKMLSMNYETLENSAFLNQKYGMFQSLNSSQTGAEYVLKSLFLLSGQFFSFISIFIVMAKIQWLPAILLLLYFVFALLSAVRQAKFRYNQKNKINENDKKLDYIVRILNDIGFLKDLKLYQMASFLESKVIKYIENQIEYGKKAFLAYVKRNFFLTVYLGIALIFSTVVYIISYRKGFMEMSNLSICIYGFIQVLSLIDNMLNRIQRTVYESYTVQELFDFMEKVDVYEKASEEIAINYEENTTYEWEISHLCYHYQNALEYALYDINIKVKAGEKIAVVGLNGAGKSTLIKCMSGLYLNYEGEIKFRGQELRKIEKHSLEKIFGVLHQDMEVYPFTIAENVASGQNDIDYEEMRKVLRKVNLDAMIKNDSEGRNYLKKLFSENGMELSGGQAERLFIARLLYKNPDMVILDEPTASLDVYNERRMMELLFSEFAEKTMIFVTHRFTLMNDMDCIIVMKNGRVEECGTQEQLLKNRGEYAHLYEIQKEYYKENHG